MKVAPYLLILLLGGQNLLAARDPNEHAIDNSKSTQWILDGNRYDAGTVEQLQEVSHEFVFFNSLEIPVKISNSAPSCSCLDNPGIIDQEVSPGEGFVIPLRLHTANGGISEAHIDFNILPIEEKFTLYMKCEVIQTLRVLPKQINFGNHLEGEAPELSSEVNIINSDVSIEDLTLECLGPKNDYLSVAQIGETKQWCSPEGKGKHCLSKFNVNCSIDHLLPGKYNGMIDIYENHPTGDIRIRIPYSFNIIPNYTMIPSDLLLLQKSHTTQFIEKEIVVKCNKHLDTSIANIKEKTDSGVGIGEIEALGRNRFRVLLRFPVPPKSVDTEKLIFEIYEVNNKKPMLVELNLKFKRLDFHQDIKQSPLGKLIEDNSKLVTDAIQKYKKLSLSLNDRPWIVFHSVLVNGSGVPLKIPSNGSPETITFKEYLGSDNSEIGGWGDKLLNVDLDDNKYSFRHGETKKVYEDHIGQFLMILAMAGFTQDDYIFHEPSGKNIALKQLYSSLKTEVTLMHDASWLLCLMSLWEDGNSEWQNKYDQTLSVEILTKNHIQVNFQQSFNDARMPCLGTHAVFGLVNALNHCQKTGLSESTVKMGRDIMAQLYRKAELCMSHNGRFNINWLDGMDFNDSNLPIDLELNHQGHMLEWIIYGASDTQLKSQKWIHTAVNYYAKQLNQVDYEGLSYGALSHGIHALVHYQNTVLVKKSPDN